MDKKVIQCGQIKLDVEAHRANILDVLNCGLGTAEPYLNYLAQLY